MYHPVSHKGDHLSTILVNTFINDMLNVIRSSHGFLFVEDLKLIKIINSQNDAIDIQTDLNNT